MSTWDRSAGSEVELASKHAERAVCEQSARCMAYWNGVRLDFIRPCKLLQYCYVERFNGKLRNACSSEQ